MRFKRFRNLSYLFVQSKQNENSRENRSMVDKLRLARRRRLVDTFCVALLLKQYLKLILSCPLMFNVCFKMKIIARENDTYDILQTFR